MKGTGLALLTVALAVVAAAGIAVGTKWIPPSVVLDALLHHDAGDPDHLIVTQVRVPRTLIGLLAGIALGAGGAILQGLTRNPLADPAIFGISPGASLFVVLGISVFGVRSMAGYVWFAFLGAAVAAVIVYGIGTLGRDGATPLKIVLAGAACTAAFGSVTTGLLVTDNSTYEQFRFWQVGSLAGRDLDVAWQGLPFLAAGLVLAVACARLLNGLSMGDDVASSLGLNVPLSRVLCVLAVVVLCGTATAMAGPIAFVGLVVPHFARLITGPDHRWLLPYSAVLAALLVLVADILGRVIARPGEVQVGIITAVLGAPVLVVLVRRRKWVSV
ncbi:iron ABC transporter permease [Amycolatopsis dongchuanensis]|uniref:Iron chelate uptake ABC transporter family permease subunit n=1 Tax=Amycolatopsis dongchuanensis TaxID=1070866 RepID=A0ABP9PRP3_9PSEU